MSGANAFALQIERFAAKTQQRLGVVFDTAVELTRASIVDGSSITGAPGQPVSTSGSPNDGELRDSWTVTRDSRLSATIATAVEYAPNVEDNVHGVVFANHGPHSVKLTRAGWPNIVAAAAAGLP